MMAVSQIVEVAFSTEVCCVKAGLVFQGV